MVVFELKADNTCVRLSAHGGMAMKATSSRTLFGLLLGLIGGICFGLVARLAVLNILRTEYNSYYAGTGSGMPVLGMVLIGWGTGVLVPMLKQRLLRPLVGAGAWLVGETIFLSLPFVYSTLLIPGPVIAVCSIISVLGGALVGGIAAWVDLP